MFGISRKSRRSTKASQCHQLGVENRLETRCLLSTASLVGGTLMVTGTDKPDSIEVQLDRSGKTIQVLSGFHTMAKFNTSDVSLIQVNGLGGDDKIVISNRIKINAIIDAGEGNDNIATGSGSSILLGGAGDDTLYGGDSRDILVGGDGSDFLIGGGDDDILIGARTSFDEKTPIFVHMLKVWNSDDSYEVRVKSLYNGSEGTPPLTKQNVDSDGSLDNLAGNSGEDWFLTAGQPTKIEDQQKDEMVI